VCGRSTVQRWVLSAGRGIASNGAGVFAEAANGHSRMTADAARAQARTVHENDRELAHR
jgi:hypothetical protein